MSAPILDIQDVHVTYKIGGGMLKPKRDLYAVSGISFSVAKGEVLSIVGESGCGKSTLAKTILGIEKPTQGRVLLGGEDVHASARGTFASRIQAIFQDPYSSLNPRKTVQDLIAMPLVVQGGRSKAEINKIVAETMDLVGLPTRLTYAYPTAMSGGQRQRVAIARAIVTRPEVIVCDEPTSALDVSVQAQILNLLDDLRRDLNLTYLFISHNLSVVNHISDRVAVIYLGKLIELGAAQDVLQNPQHPYTQKLRAATLEPERGAVLPKPEFRGGFPDPTNPPPGCAFNPRCTIAEAQCSQTMPALLPAGPSHVRCHLAQRP